MKQMKIFAAILAMIFVGIAVFGFMAMNHMGEGQVHSCLASTAQAIDCAKGDALAFISFHAEAFRNFSTATFNSLVTGIVLLGVLFSGLRFRFGPVLKIGATARITEENFSVSLKQILTRWISLHENSPSVI